MTHREEYDVLGGASHCHRLGLDSFDLSHNLQILVTDVKDVQRTCQDYQSLDPLVLVLGGVEVAVVDALDFQIIEGHSRLESSDLRFHVPEVDGPVFANCHCVKTQVIDVRADRTFLVRQVY